MIVIEIVGIQSNHVMRIQKLLRMAVNTGKIKCKKLIISSRSGITDIPDFIPFEGPPYIKVMTHGRLQYREVRNILVNVVAPSVFELRGAQIINVKICAGETIDTNG